MTNKFIAFIVQNSKLILLLIYMWLDKLLINDIPLADEEPGHNLVWGIETRVMLCLLILYLLP